MAYFAIVGRLDCASSSVEHLGFWEMNGYGIMSMYKSDWERLGGENNLNSNFVFVLVVSLVPRDYLRVSKLLAFYLIMRMLNSTLYESNKHSAQ